MAEESIAIVVNSAPSTSITFAPSGTLTAPVPANTVIGSITIAPAGWVGALVLSGADEANFSLSAPVGDVSDLLNTVQLDAKTYSLTVSSAP